MTIYKQPGSPYYYYDFYFEGRRYQKSTHLRNKTIAHRVREGKSDRAVRDVPITSCALPIFKRRLSNAKGEYLFPRRVGNGYDWSRPMTELEPAHLRALRKSEIQPPFRLYDLRHTYGTRAVEAGIDVFSVAKLMGHADLRTTERYVHLSKAHLEDAQKKIERYRVRQRSL